MFVFLQQNWLVLVETSVICQGLKELKFSILGKQVCKTSKILPVFLSTGLGFKNL